MNIIYGTSKNEVKRLIDEGMNLRKKGEYLQAGKRFDAAAALGSAEALYLAGDNVMDTVRAARTTICTSYQMLLEDAIYRQFDYFYRCADLGYTPAMLRLAEYYQRGCVHFAPNPSKAVYWYSRALRFGEEDAREPLATCYDLGFGVERNRETAQKIRDGSSNS